MSDENDESGNVSLYSSPFFSSTQNMFDENNATLYTPSFPNIDYSSGGYDSNINYVNPGTSGNNPSAYVGGSDPPVKYTYENNVPSGVNLVNAGGVMSTSSDSNVLKALKNFFGGNSSTGTYAGAAVGLLGLLDAYQKNKQRKANQVTQAPLNLNKYKYLPSTTNKPAPRAYGAGAMGQQYAAPQPVLAAEGGLMAKGGSTNYLRGNTDGMADKLDTSIEGVQPAKLSHGEFVVPADVVSHLGNGNSEAGADVLYKMLDSIRHARTGNKKQGKRINPNKFMPGGIASLNNYAAGGQVAFETGGTAKVTGPGTVTSAVSPYAQEYVGGMLEKGAALSNKPYEAYGGQLTAGTSPLQQKAFDAASNLSIPASVGQGSTMIKSAGDKLGNLSYSSSPVSSTYNAPTGYSAGSIGNAYTGTGAYSPEKATSQFTSTGAYNAKDATNQFSGPQEYQASSFGNQYADTGAYNAQNATNQFSGPAEYKAGQFGNQYKATDPYTASNMQLDKFNTAQMQQYMNPYLQMSLEPQIAEARRQSQITQMGNAAKLAQAGAFGGSRGALMDTETQRNLLQNLAGITGQGYNTAYNTALNSFNTQQGLGLQAQQANEASRQFGANQGLSNAQNAAQYGMAALNAGEASRQFGANQAMTAAQQRAQYGQAAQTQNMQDRQFGASQALANAQNRAQYGMAALNAGEASKQFGSNQAMTAAQQAAQFGQAAQAQNAQQQQFGASQALANAQTAAQYGQAAQAQNANQQQFAANQALANAQSAAQYGLAGFNATEQAKQTQGAQALSNAQNAAQYGQAAQALNAQQQQFGANLGLNALQSQLSAGASLGGLGVQENQMGLANLNAQAGLGASQSAIEQATLDAERRQFEESQLYPYKQLQFQQSLLTGLPISAQTATGDGSIFSDLTSGIGGILNTQQAVDKAVKPG